MTVNIFESPEETLEKLAEYFITVAQQGIANHSKFSVALSGGSSPKKLYEILSADYKNSIDWNKIYFFFGDERYVPKTDPKSNFLMAKKALFDPLGILETQVFAVDTSFEPKVAARKYADVLNNFFEGCEINFDLVLLGLGDNSHTASLFPHTNVLYDKAPSVKEIFLKDQNVYRITLNAPLINQANHIAFLVYGEAKAEAVQHILEGEKDINDYPAQLINPVNGDLQWFLDNAAATNLNDTDFL